MKALLVDAYDSFVYIIEQYLKTLGVGTTTLRCDDPRIEIEISNGSVDFVLLGPGPGRPEDAGYPALIRRINGEIPIFGVCLGHQAIGQVFGASVDCAEHIMHGKTSEISNDGLGVFSHTGGKSIVGTRYHSLIVRFDESHSNLIVTARSQCDGYIMGVRHRNLPIEGVQFHPESIATEEGIKIFSSFIKSYLDGNINRAVRA